jgi:hypothetical protein
MSSGWLDRAPAAALGALVGQGNPARARRAYGRCHPASSQLVWSRGWERLPGPSTGDDLGPIEVANARIVTRCWRTVDHVVANPLPGGTSTVAWQDD